MPTQASEILPETRAGKEDVEETGSSSGKILCREMQDFLESMEKLTLEEINDPARKWQCPACSAADDLHQGIHALAVHTRAKAFVRPHRAFVELLKEELQRRITSLVPSEEIKDREIVWPPMVLIRNTSKIGADGKPVGMETSELLMSFSCSFLALRAQHSYGPQGDHRGISLLMFEKSAYGYLKAERLHDHLLKKGTGRQAWEDPSRCYDHGQLYGYLASESDLEDFNQHSCGTQRVEHEMIRYVEMVVSELNQSIEDSEMLEGLELEFASEHKQWRAWEQELKRTNDELMETLDDILFFKERAKKYDMDFPNNFEKVLRDERRKAEESSLEEKEETFEQLLVMVKKFDADVTQLTQLRSLLLKSIHELLKRGSDAAYYIGLINKIDNYPQDERRKMH